MAFSGPTLPTPPDPDLETKVRSEAAYTARRDENEPGPPTEPGADEETRVRAEAANLGTSGSGRRNGRPGAPSPTPDPKTETFVRSEIARTLSAGPRAAGRPLPPDQDSEELTHARDEIVTSRRYGLPDGSQQPGEEAAQITEARHDVAWAMEAPSLDSTRAVRRTLLGHLAQRQALVPVGSGART